jgi:hypothetical protein
MQPFQPPPKPNYAAPLLGMGAAPNPNAKLIPRLPNGQIDYQALLKIAAPQNQPKPVFQVGAPNG